MADKAYHELCETLAKRRGRYPGKDIPEFYALVEELFTKEEAEVYNAVPKGFHPAETIAKGLGKEVTEVTPLLEGMADKGLCTAGSMGGMTFYGAPTFVPGIFEFQFMRGTHTERDKKIARLIRAYKAAVDADQGPVKITYPTTRVIPVDEKIQAENAIHTYHQVASYIQKYHPLSVSTCFCRHEAKLIDEKDDCGNPDEVCMQGGGPGDPEEVGRGGSGPRLAESSGYRLPLQLLRLSFHHPQDGPCPGETRPGAELRVSTRAERRSLHRLRDLCRSLPDRCAGHE